MTLPTHARRTRRVDWLVMLDGSTKVSGGSTERTEELKAIAGAALSKRVQIGRGRSRTGCERQQ